MHRLEGVGELIDVPLPRRAELRGGHRERRLTIRANCHR
jgi:hypothetical protein